MHACMYSTQHFVFIEGYNGTNETDDYCGGN